MPPLKDINHSLEIDEEGYPMFGGLRIHDPQVLLDIFSHLRRSQPELPRSKIVTCLEAKHWAWIDAFDAPLVAQSAHLLSQTEARLEFLGGLSETLPVDLFEVDEWDRLHALVGTQCFPAVLSRKAQALLLNDFVARGVSPQLKRFRDPAGQALSKSDYWSQAYADRQDGWELGGPHPALTGQDWKRFEGARVLVPGAGRAHDAAFLAPAIASSEVLALDFSEEAVRFSRERYAAIQNLSCEKADVFEFLKAQPEASWDLVFEHTFFCAIDPLRRHEYLREVRRVLKPGGRWIGIFFLLEHAGGPPFALTQWELRESVKKDFDIKAWQRLQASPSGRTHKELWAEFSRRST
jgi:SAM-dependent methyltransferase